MSRLSEVISNVPRVTVIVVSYNSRLYLPACLSSVAGQEDVPTEVIVVDNASTDGSAALVSAMFPTARIIANRENRGLAAAANQGLSLARGEFILLLNPDAFLLPGALTTLVEFLEMHPRTAAVGPRQWIDADCTWQWSIVPSPPHWRLLLSGLPCLRRLNLARQQLLAYWALNRAIWRNEQSQATPYLSGACLLLRRTALQQVGGLDEGYFLFLEEVDLCKRLRAAGWMLHAVPAAGVVHAGLGSVRYLPNSGQSHLLSSGSRYLARHGDPLTRALWALLRMRRTRRAVHQDHPNERKEPVGTMALTLRWPPISGAANYWLELASDPTFLYVAATEVAQPACALPQELLTLPFGSRFFWRVAAVNAKGELGTFSSIQSGAVKEQQTGAPE